MKPVEVDITPELATRFTARPESVTFLRSSQNLVYEITNDRGQERILRLTPGSHRSMPEIEDELNWLGYLHDAGLSVCPPIALEDGTYIQSIPSSQGAFYGVLFEKAQGRLPARPDMSPEFYYLHGKQLGLLHDQSRKSPREWLMQRRMWNEERYFTTDITRFLPEEVGEPLMQHFQMLREQAVSIPPTRENFGPVHFDLGYSNFFIDGERLVMFDFDNCTPGPYVGDIAAALYSSIFNGLRCEFPGDRSAFESPKTGRNLAQVWKPFREGYESASIWPAEAGRMLPIWFEIMYLRAVVHAFRMQHPVTDPRAKALLDADVNNILTRGLPINFDFHKGEATT
jgi:Ser/Thr protein kinase RdoA (MazF antagonist)